MHEFPGRFDDREHFYALAARIEENAAALSLENERPGKPGRSRIV